MISNKIIYSWRKSNLWGVWNWGNSFCCFCERRDITSSYILDNGQRDTFYDYGRLKRVASKSSPSKKIKVYFQSGFYNTNDDGDITTVNSYNSFDYSKEIESEI